jgi:predicted ATPase/Tfp pilus assembly protein PilF/transcriptional regulator with XRE-family HTH domain
VPPAPAAPATLGSWLAALRRQAHWTQQELAEAARLSPETVSHIERGVVRAARSRGRGADGATRALLAQALRARFAELAQARGSEHWLTPEEAAELSAQSTHLLTAASGPAPHGLPGPPGAGAGASLPVPPTSFVGRVRERAAVAALLARPEVRLLTLTGPGGVGKTRLALQVATERPLESAPPVFVALAALREPGAVLPAIARALGVREDGVTPLPAALQAALAGRALLLVLDNCEQVRAAAPELAALLAGCPRLQVLATSRAPWHLQGEHEYALEPLALPPPQETAPAALGVSEAVALFVARAQAVKPSFALSASSAPVVAALCRQLEGLPLAIELAAAQLKLLTPRTLLGLLGRRLALLVGGPRDAPERQQTLRATLSWSYELLSPAEQTLLRRLCVFVGGCRLEAMAAVCGGGAELVGDLLQWLGALVDQSLVRAEEDADGETRVVLLETIREYGLERLAGSGELEALRERHLDWCLALAEGAEPLLRGSEQGQWLERLDAEHDNLRAALAWARERGAGEQGLRLAGTLWRFWEIRGYLSEGRGWLESMLAAGTGGSAPATARARSLNGAGTLAFAQGEYGRAVALHEEALAIRRTLGDTHGIAASLNNLGNVAHVQGEYGRAAALHEESLALKRELGDTRGISASLNNLGNVAHQQGDYGRAAALYEESLALDRSLGDQRGIADSLNNLGGVAYAQGEHGRAVALYEESLALDRELGDQQGIANSLHTLGDVAHQQGDYGRAAALYEESLALFRELGDRWGIAESLIGLGRVAFRQGDHGRAAALLAEALLLGRDIGARRWVTTSLEGLAWVAGARGRPDQAARLGGTAAALREAQGVPLPPEERGSHDQAVQAMRAALGEEGFAAAWAAGRALPLEEAIALALEGDEPTAPGSGAADAM